MFVKYNTVTSSKLLLRIILNYLFIIDYKEGPKMTDKRVNAQQQKKNIAEQTWLNYFNQTLFEKGLITESERNRMKNLISNRTPSSARH